MKKWLVLLAILILLPIGLAEEEQNAGIGPDSPFYALDRFIERLQLALAGDEIHKAKLHLKFAGERLEEAKKMTIKLKVKARERAIEEYEEEINETIEAVDKARGIGQNVSQIVKEINVSMAKHIAVLELVKAKVPEQAQIAIERNINRSKERIQTMEAKKAEKEEKGINVVSDVEIGGAVVYKIFEGYEELNAPYENQGRNNTE